MRLVTLLRQAYGDEVNKIPGFNEFAQSASKESKKVMVESAAQTSYDLLETWFPALRGRLPKSCGGSSHGESDEDAGSEQRAEKRLENSSGCSIIGRKCFSPRDKLYPIERENTPVFPWLDNSYASFPNQLPNVYDESKQIASYRVDING